MDWIKGIQEAIRYIEENITEELDYEDIAKQAHVSSFHFQRGFSILCGLTLGEYIRNRRLTLAGMELSSGSAKIIDTALKYGYDSPDSFTKAFTRFHDVSPSSVKKGNANLKSVAPLKITLKLEGGNIMDYRIEKKEALKVVGASRPFTDENMNTEVPKFWQEHFDGGDGKHVLGMFGISYKDANDGDGFNYMIADFADGKGEMPDKFAMMEIPALTWAVFPTKGAMPKAIQETTHKVFSEWLPNCHEYKLDGSNYHIEMYSAGDPNSEEYYTEVWVPVKKV